MQIIHNFLWALNLVNSWLRANKQCQMGPQLEMCINRSIHQVYIMVKSSKISFSILIQWLQVVQLVGQTFGQLNLSKVIWDSYHSTMDWLECSPIDPLAKWLKVIMIHSSCNLMRPKFIKEEIKRLHHCSHSIIHQLIHPITLYHSLLEKTITKILDAMPHGSTQKRLRSSIIPMSPSTKWLPPFVGHGKTLSISTALMACSSNPRSLTTSL